MSRPDPIRYDTFARALATGASMHAAAVAAGYARTSSKYRRIAQRPEFLELVARYRREARQAARHGLEPVIAELMEQAGKALDNGSAQHIAVAAWLLGQAGRARPVIGKRRLSRGRLLRERTSETLYFDRWSEPEHPRAVRDPAGLVPHPEPSIGEPPRRSASAGGRKWAKTP